MLKSLHSLGSCAENFLLIQISFILSDIFTRLGLKCQRMFWWASCISARHGPLARYVKLRVRMRRECRERFPRHRRWVIPTCITARASRTCRDACRDRQLSVSFEIGGGGKRSRHSRRMRNLQFYVSGKRPMLGALIVWWPASFWLQWTMAEGTVHTGSPAKFPTKPTEEWKKN